MKIPIGTPIRFTKELSCGPSDEHPALLYAKRGQLGEITGWNDRPDEGYMVRTSDWQTPFGASPSEFEVIKCPTSKPS